MSLLNRDRYNVCNSIALTGTCGSTIQFRWYRTPMISLPSAGWPHAATRCLTLDVRSLYQPVLTQALLGGFSAELMCDSILWCGGLHWRAWHERQVDDHTAAELRALSGKCADGAQVRRILALALVLDGRSRSDAAALNGMDRQTLRDWVHRYNAEGVDGLKSRTSPGREPFLNEQQRTELRDLVIQGLDPDIHKVVRWRCVDLQAEVARRWSVAVHVSTIGKWLGELGLTRLQPRPLHPKKDAAAEAAFKQTSPAWSAKHSSAPQPVRL